MATIRTLLHSARVVDQIQQNLIGLQSDMTRNAATWKAQAQAAIAKGPSPQNIPLATLQTWMHDAAANYRVRLNWYTTLQADVDKRQRVIDELRRRGWSESDITDITSSLKQVANQLFSSIPVTYAAVVTACDSIAAAVNQPDSLWPE